MYNYAIPNSTVRQATQYASRGGNAMSAPMTGADPTLTDKLKTFMDSQTMGVANKYLIGGALVLGVGYYGYTKGWF